HCLKELADQELRAGLEQPLANTRDHAADLGLPMVANDGLLPLFLQLDHAVSFDETRPPVALDQQAIACWRLLVAYLDFTGVRALDRANAHAHGRVIGVFGDLAELLGRRQGGTQGVGVEQHSPDALARSGEGVRARYVHVS